MKNANNFQMSKVQPEGVAKSAAYKKKRVKVCSETSR